MRWDDAQRALFDRSPMNARRLAEEREERIRRATIRALVAIGFLAGMVLGAATIGGQ